MAKKGGGYVRVKERTQIAIKMIAGEIQTNTGESASADEVLWTIIQKMRPDIAERAEELEKKEPDKNSGHKN